MQNSQQNRLKTKQKAQLQKINCQQKQNNRQDQPIILFVIHLLIAFIISFQNIFIVYGVKRDDYINVVYIISGELIFVCLFCLGNSLYFVRSWKEIIAMYSLFDMILATEIAAEIGLVGSLLIVYQGYTHQTLIIVMLPLSFFFFVGNFRITIKYANWTRAQIIIYKLVIMAGAVCFFQIGAYFMAVNYTYTNGMLPELDSKLTDFITLYAFGTFQFFLALFSKICDFDQTTNLLWVYKWKKDQKSSKNNSQSSLVDNQTKKKQKKDQNIFVQNVQMNEISLKK